MSHLLSRAIRPGELVKEHQKESTFQIRFRAPPPLRRPPAASVRLLFLEPRRLFVGSSSHGSGDSLLVIHWRSLLPPTRWTPASSWLICRCFSPSTSWSPSGRMSLTQHHRAEVCRPIVRRVVFLLTVYRRFVWCKSSLLVSVVSYVVFVLPPQLTLVISTSLILNNRLFRSENLVPALTWKSNNR